MTAKAKTIQEACTLYVDVRDKWFSLKTAAGFGFNEVQIMHFQMFNMLRTMNGHKYMYYKFKQNPALLLIEKEMPDTMRVLHNRINELKYAHN